MVAKWQHQLPTTDGSHPQQLWATFHIPNILPTLPNCFSHLFCEEPFNSQILQTKEAEIMTCPRSPSEPVSLWPPQLSTEKCLNSLFTQMCFCEWLKWCSHQEYLSLQVALAITHGMQRLKKKKKKQTKCFYFGGSASFQKNVCF